MKKTLFNEKELNILYDFLEKYGKDVLINILQNYDYSQQTYTCKTRLSTTQIPINHINYIEIFGHEIIIHTIEGNFTKYGTLKKEYAELKKQGFIKCNQSFLIPINKISKIQGKFVILTTGDKFPLSRSCASDVIHAYIDKNIRY